LIYIVGSYAYPGIPLLEGCVGSSKHAVRYLVDDLNLSLSSGSTSQSDREKRDGSKEEEEVDWSKGRGGVIGRVWRWRSGEGS
jgi:hypothetical protein